MATYLFDFDGTLVDSMPTYAAMMLGILAEHHIPHTPDIIKVTTPLGYRGTAELFCRMGLPLSVDALMEVMTSRAVEAYTYRVPAKAHVPEVLRALRDRGDSLNVLTASPHAMLDPCLLRLGLYDLFDNVWSCDDFSTTKSDPGIYRMAAARLGRAVEEVTFLDDNPGADKTAKAAGMRVIGVYDDSSAEYEQEMREICDGYIRDFEELPALFI